MRRWEDKELGKSEGRKVRENTKTYGLKGGSSMNCLGSAP